jgi:hypothetical protein
MCLERDCRSQEKCEVEGSDGVEFVGQECGFDGSGAAGF